MRTKFKDYARRGSYVSVSGRGFDSPRLHFSWDLRLGCGAAFGARRCASHAPLVRLARRRFDPMGRRMRGSIRYVPLPCGHLRLRRPRVSLDLRLGCGAAFGARRCASHAPLVRLARRRFDPMGRRMRGSIRYVPLPCGHLRLRRPRVGLGSPLGLRRCVRSAAVRCRRAGGDQRWRCLASRISRRSSLAFSYSRLSALRRPRATPSSTLMWGPLK